MFSPREIFIIVPSFDPIIEGGFKKKESKVKVSVGKDEHRY